MKLQDNPFLFSYKDYEANEHTFVINPEESDKKNVLIYNQFINGLYTGNRFSITEIHFIMNNGFEWKTVF